mmetsp:Transcript_23039/g.33838  ORF Transcript_23039/g.33838 Transcript_23039/m.33838 type:complete len:331 (+) Transcript_23039:117-1109(+)
MDATSQQKRRNTDEVESPDTRIPQRIHRKAPRIWCRCHTLPKSQTRGNWQCEHVRRLWKSDIYLVRAFEAKQKMIRNAKKANSARNVAENFTAVMHHKSTGKSLALFSSDVDDGRMRVIAKMLATNTDISTVSLWGNCIGDEGAIQIAKLLRVNCTITVLYLHNNCIGDRGAAAIAEALRANITLERLTLGHNNITNFGVASIFSRCLNQNTTLKTLSLVNNRVASLTFKNFIQELHQSRDIRTVVEGKQTLINKAVRVLIRRILRKEMHVQEQPGFLSWIAREQTLSTMFTFLREKPHYLDTEQNAATITDNSQTSRRSCHESLKSPNR